jgi:hypothetical protein
MIQVQNEDFHLKNIMITLGGQQDENNVQFMSKYD